MSDLKRSYPGSAFTMLTTCATIVHSAVNNQAFLLTKRPGWADPFFPDLASRIENDFKTCLGIDPKQKVRTATDVWNEIKETALLDMGDMYIQLKEGFRDNKVLREELLVSLGFSKYYKKSQGSSQQAIINLFLQFTKNLTEEVRAKLVADGVAADLIDRMVAYGISLNEANLEQEKMKGTSQELTAEAVMELNAVYEEVITVAKMARRFFKDDPVKKEFFSFTRLLKQQGVSYKKSKTEEDSTATA